MQTVKTNTYIAPKFDGIFAFDQYKKLQEPINIALRNPKCDNVCIVINFLNNEKEIDIYFVEILAAIKTFEANKKVVIQSKNKRKIKAAKESAYAYLMEKCTVQYNKDIDMYEFTIRNWL
jgi:hypothetical protein